MNDQLTPNKLFLAYAVGCIESLVCKGSITQEQYNLLRRFAQTGEEPSNELMERCFPKACMRIGYPRTSERVRHFWRVVHRNPFEESPVYVVEIVALQSTSDMHFVQATRIDADTIHTGYYENVRHIPLDIGFKVYVHGMVVAEQYTE